MSEPNTPGTPRGDIPPVDLGSIPRLLPLLRIQGNIPLPMGVESVGISFGDGCGIGKDTDPSAGLFWTVWVSEEDSAKRPDQELPRVGMICRLLSLREIGGGHQRIELEGVCRARLARVVDTQPVCRVEIDPVVDDFAAASQTNGRVSECLDLLKQLVEETGEYPIDLVQSADTTRSSLDRFTDLIGTSIRLRLEDKWQLAQTPDPAVRLDLLVGFLRAAIAMAGSARDLEHRVQESLNRRKRADFLRTQMAEVRRELESLEPGADELDQLADEIAGAHLPSPVARRARTELERLRIISTASAEYIEIRNYIDWLIHIPWTAVAHERTETSAIRRLLDEQVYGQRKAKERIVEYLNVLHRTGRSARNILCLIGPTGIGKTQLGRAIALALRRPTIGINLGILRSETALKGNRRTFPGAMPGRILRQLRAVEVVNPVCLLEEVDRLGGNSDLPDLSAILLEMVDPRLNEDLWDYYLGFPYDLSRILFICTATDPESIPEMLADRMEFIELPGYLETEKVEVTFKHLWPRQLEAHRIPAEEVGLTVAAVQKIVREYTLEAGLANLDKSLEVICRNISVQRAAGQRGSIRVGVQQVEKYLGTPPFIPEKAETKPEIGVAMGLAWTQAGGDIMLIEGLKMRGSGNVISTGSLGEVMRESIQAAHSYVRSRADWLGINHEDFGNYDIHVHFPSGAIPKDGPSAGITVSLVIASVLSDRPIRNDIASTGEVTLRGKVLPVGGVKEKVAAAHRVGIHKLIVPRENIKDLQDVPGRISKEMTYIPVDTVDEVFEAALLDFDPSRTSLEKLLRIELARKSEQRKSKVRSRTKVVKTRSRKT